MSVPRILVAGIGNIFLGDDGFGVEVTQRLLQRRWPDEVRVIDFGIRSLDLTYALLDGYETVILVDVAPRGGRPGTLYVIEPQDADQEPVPMESLDMHGMDPAKVLRLARRVGGLQSVVKNVLLVGCEPQRITGDEEPPQELSPPVQAAIPEAVRLVESLVEKSLKRPANGSHPQSDDRTTSSREKET
jgi:hydrogenase maturation protease